MSLFQLFSGISIWTKLWIYLRFHFMPGFGKHVLCFTFSGQICRSTASYSPDLNTYMHFEKSQTCSLMQRPAGTQPEPLSMIKQAQHGCPSQTRGRGAVQRSVCVWVGASRPKEINQWLKGKQNNVMSRLQLFTCLHADFYCTETNSAPGINVLSIVAVKAKTYLIDFYLYC